jgi:hypothetical protein
LSATGKNRALVIIPERIIGVYKPVYKHSLKWPQNWVLRGFSQVSVVLGAPAVEIESNTLGKSHPFTSSNQNDVAEVNRR